MTNESLHPNDEADALEDLLVAYLDGELSPDASQEIERRLSEDIELRRRLLQHQQAWDLLDDMPRTEVDDGFTRTTIEMVAVSAADDVQQVKRQSMNKRHLAWTLGGAGIMLAVIAGFLISWSIQSMPDRQLVEDLPIIENLDAYRNAESVEFLRALEHEGLFIAEVEDAL